MNRTRFLLPSVAVLFVVGAGAAVATSGDSNSLPSQVKTYCDHGHRLYVNGSNNTPALVPFDPSCPQPTPPPPTVTATTKPPVTTTKPPPSPTQTVVPTPIPTPTGTPPVDPAP